jgi:uncharacterized membrane protein YdjX (TVP38/TMEM64 family)
MWPKIPCRIIILLLLVAAGLVIHHMNIFDVSLLIESSDLHLYKWWFPLLLILGNAVLYAFALPGSAMYLVAGLLYNPFYATLIIVAGGVSGAVAAYHFSSFMSEQARNRIQETRIFSIIRKQGDFATLCAIRTLPGFPHSVINYGSGLLSIPIHLFISTAIIGFSAKGFIYASAVQRATATDRFTETGRLETVLPLIGLAFLFVAGRILHKKLFK